MAPSTKFPTPVALGPPTLEQQLGDYLRRVRGKRTYAEFSRVVGLPPSTIHRLEHANQSVTLGRLEVIMRRLGGTLPDIFPGR